MAESQLLLIEVVKCWLEPQPRLTIIVSIIIAPGFQDSPRQQLVRTDCALSVQSLLLPHETNHC